MPISALHMFERDAPRGVEQFVELTQGYGVVDVVRVSTDTLHVVLCRDPRPEEIKYIRRMAHDWWGHERIVLAVVAGLKELRQQTMG